MRVEHKEGGLNMGYSAGKISPPVSIYDVQQPCWVRLKRTVGGQVQTIYSSDLGVLCSASVGDIIPARDGNENWTVDARGEINKWARYKPERSAGPKPLIHGQMLSSSRSRKGNNFGLEIPYCHLDVMNSLVHSIVEREAEAWSYLKPRGDMSHAAGGGVEEFYRLTDFVRIPTDDTDPYYNTVYAKGYNHNAKVPFVSWMDMTGVSERYAAGVEPWYEVNKQVSNKIKIFFQNSIGDDLHLQDFIDLTGFPDSSGRSWRPVLQVFNDYTPAGGDPWYQRSQPDMQIVGARITNATTDLWEVELPLDNYPNNANVYYHLCVGIGCVNDNQTSWLSNDSLFLLPYTQEQDDNSEYPFYYKFSVVSHAERIIRFTVLDWFNTGTVQDVVATGTPPYFDVTYGASGVVWLTFTITKSTTKAQFVTESMTPDTGYSPLKIKAVETITGSSTESTFNLTPMTNGNHTAQVNTSAKIEAGDSSQTVTLYAKLDIELSHIPVGGYGTYRIFSKEGPDANEWVDNGYFRVRRLAQ